MRAIAFLLGGIALWVAGCTQAPEAYEAQAEEAKEVREEAKKGQVVLSVDTDASEIIWVGTKVTGRHTGTVKIKEGILYLDNGKLSGGNFTIDMTTIENKDLEGEWKQKLENHLKSPDFFAVDSFPTSEFVITNVEPIEGVDTANYMVEGNLTIRGITKSIRFPVKEEKAEGDTYVYTTAFNINRKEWNVMYDGKPDDLIRNEIHFKIKLVAKPSEEAVPQPVEEEAS